MESIKHMTNYTPLNACIMVIDSDMAKEFLKSNNSNREIDMSLVAKYAKDMSAGNFTLNPDAIAFDQDGNLVNGQHRLAAIVRSGVPTACVVIFNFPVTRTDFLNFDCGKNRAIRVRIGLAGYEVPYYAVDIAGAYLRVKYRDAYNSVPMRLDFINANHDVMDWAVKTGSVSGNSSSRIPSIFMVALIDAKLAGLSDEIIQAFARVYCRNDFSGTDGFNPRHVIELRDAKIARHANDRTVNTVKSRLNAFAHKLSKCYFHDDLYVAPRLPMRTDESK